MGHIALHLIYFGLFKCDICTPLLRYELGTNIYAKRRNFSVSKALKSAQGSSCILAVCMYYFVSTNVLKLVI